MTSVHARNFVIFFWFGLILACSWAWADPSKYPEFAALGHSHSHGVEPEFIHVDQLVEHVLAHEPVTIVDVRSPDEYASGHIKGAVSVPLRDLAANVALVPKEHLVALY